MFGVNMKNAFNLKLIDYMTEVLRKKDDQLSNFQVSVMLLCVCLQKMSVFS